MLSLSSFFQKFHKLEKSKQTQIGEFVSLIKSVCSVTLDSSEIVIEENTARLLTSPLKRNEIFMHKEEILERLKESGSKLIVLR
jgi:hypothetical protein